VRKFFPVDGANPAIAEKVLSLPSVTESDKRSESRGYWLGLERGLDQAESFFSSSPNSSSAILSAQTLVEEKERQSDFARVFIFPDS
jgi:hypothetical protein